MNELEEFKAKEMKVHPDSLRTSVGRHPDLMPQKSPGISRRPSGTLKSGDLPGSQRSFMHMLKGAHGRLTRSLETAFNPPST